METTYSAARAQLADLLDRAIEDREVVYIHRRGKGSVALVAADELAGLIETAHLLRSPRNAARLLAALRRAQGGRTRPRTVASVRSEFGLGRPD